MSTLADRIRTTLTTDLATSLATGRRTATLSPARAARIRWLVAPHALHRRETPACSATPTR